MTDDFLYAEEDLLKLVARCSRILKQLYAIEELNISELAEKTKKDVSNVSRCVRELEKAGLVHVKSLGSRSLLRVRLSSDRIFLTSLAGCWKMILTRLPMHTAKCRICRWPFNHKVNTK